MVGLVGGDLVELGDKEVGLEKRGKMEGRKNICWRLIRRKNILFTSS